MVHFNNKYNDVHAVERYNVTVTPDPSSCSSDQVSSSEDYSCPGLDLETNYTITVSAINCRDQEGETTVNFLILNGILYTYVDKNMNGLAFLPAPPVPDVSVSKDDLNNIRVEWIEQQV